MTAHEVVPSLPIDLAIHFVTDGKVVPCYLMKNLSHLRLDRADFESSHPTCVMLLTSTPREEG